MRNSALAVQRHSSAPVTRQDASALDRLVRLVKSSKDKPFIPGDFERFEQELTARLREVGREALKAELQKADVATFGAKK